MSKRSTIGAAVSGVILGACASTPAVLQGDFYEPISPDQAAVQQRTGSYVRWGGDILSVTHGKNDTCFDILSRPLDSRAKPEQGTDFAGGRYRACAPGFYDPAVYKPGRAITTTGLIDREATQSFESFKLKVPVVTAEVVYLWPRRVYYAAPYPAYGYGWGFGASPYAYRWGPYYGPWFGAGFPGPYYGYGYGYRLPYRYGYRGGHGGGRHYRG